jgi:hypothetical protein
MERGGAVLVAIFSQLDDMTMFVFRPWIGLVDLFWCPPQSASQHPLPQCAMKPTVFDQRNLPNLHNLTLAQ